MPDHLSTSILRCLQPGVTTRPRSYALYGLHVDSDIPLTCSEWQRFGPVDVTLFLADEEHFSEVDRVCRASVDDWFFHLALPDGRQYLRWTDLFEFLISADGRRIGGRPLQGASLESFQTYLVTQVLSFALLKQGFEPLHATAVLIGDKAVAFLGDCGYGKSTLGGLFLKYGYRLLTDDLLVLTPSLPIGTGFMGHPGLPRIKLFPHAARALIPGAPAGTPLNPETSKLIIPLSASQITDRAVPIGALYILNSPKHDDALNRIEIKDCTQREACLALLSNTFNTIDLDSSRLGQQFNHAAAVVRRTPVRLLSYPRRMDRLSELLDSILADVA
jgi:hypothetical protein